VPPPAFIGLPPKFTEWRKNQADAIYGILSSEKQVVMSICPTGFGKSLMYVAASLLYGGKTVILTSTKALQAQLLRDFADIGMVEVKGKNAYLCPMADNALSCEEGPCSSGFNCPIKKSGCPYYLAVEAARTSRLVVTNYSFWFYSNRYSEGIGTPTLLVCDEGHDAPNAVASFLTVKLERRDEALVSGLPDNPEKINLEKWKSWAEHRLQKVSVRTEEVEEGIQSGTNRSDRMFKELAKLKRLSNKLGDVARMDLKNWVVDVTPFSVEFAPVDVRKDCQRLLYKHIPHVILTSASVNQKTAQMLGLQKDNCDVFEYPHTFPLENRMVIHVRGARINKNASGEDLKEWLKTADKIISERLDRKGIFHTTSYGRRDFVMAHSNYAPYMLTHSPKDTIPKVMQFKSAKPPIVLVSPAVTTGWDFPANECRYQILGKVPYPDTRNKITAARCKNDPEYAPYIAMQQIIQASGRPVRSETDVAETFIIDDNIGWFMQQYSRKFAPKWFREAYTTRIFPPRPADLQTFVGEERGEE